MQTASSLFTTDKFSKGRYHLPYNFEGKQVYLTSKEATIVAKLIRGQRTKEIAWELDASLHTVNTHLANIKEKLQCDNIFQLGLKLGECKGGIELN